MINLQNYNVALSASQKLVAAARHLPYTVLGRFHESNSMDFRLLDTASKNFPPISKQLKHPTSVNVKTVDYISQQLRARDAFFATSGDIAKWWLLRHKLVEDRELKCSF